MAENSKRNLLVCFAVKEEAAPFLVGRKGDYPRVLVTGMGCRNTTKAFAAALLHRIPDKVLTCGFAGGLKPELKRGTVVCETGDSRLQATLCRAGAVPGRFLCVDRIATSAEEKRALRRSSGADAVEMESAVVQEECRRRGIPCATVRVILDEVGEDLPLDFNVLLTSEARLSWAKLMTALVKAPGRVPALMLFRRQTMVAARRLTEVLLQLNG